MPSADDYDLGKGLAATLRGLRMVLEENANKVARTIVETLAVLAAGASIEVALGSVGAVTALVWALETGRDGWCYWLAMPLAAYFALACVGSHIGGRRAKMAAIVIMVVDKRGAASTFQEHPGRLRLPRSQRP